MATICLSPASAGPWRRKATAVTAYVVKNGLALPFTLNLSEMTDDERKIILAGCLINFYRGA